MDVNARNKDGCTPLHEITDRSNPEMVRLLLEAGADANAAGNDGATPLMEVWGQKDIAQILLAYGADIDKGHRKYTFSFGEGVYMFTFEEETLLISAVMSANNEDAMNLLYMGADPDVSDKYGQSAIDLYTSDRRVFVDAFIHRVSAVKGTFTQGDRSRAFHLADRRISTEFKYGVAFRAVSMGNIASLRKIIYKGGFDVKHLNKLGQSFLYVACYNRHPRIVDLLLNYGANPDIGWPGEQITPAMVIAGNCGDAFKNTANQYCCAGLFLSDHGNKEENFEARTEILRLLVMRGADLNIRNQQGMTAYAIAKNNCVGHIFQQVITICVQQQRMPQTMADQILFIGPENKKTDISKIEILMSSILYYVGLVPSPTPLSLMRPLLNERADCPSLEELVETGWMFYLNHPEYMSKNIESVFEEGVGIMFILRLITKQVPYPEALKAQLNTLIDILPPALTKKRSIEVMRGMLRPSEDVDVTEASTLLEVTKSLSKKAPKGLLSDDLPALGVTYNPGQIVTVLELYVTC